MNHKNYLYVLLFFICACQDSKTSNHTVVNTENTSVISAEEVALQWKNYKVLEPNDDMKGILYKKPAEYIERKCIPIEADHPLYDSEAITKKEDGSQELCLWNHVAGNVPEGYKFDDFLTCENIWTQGPSWFMHPEQLHQSDPNLLNDPDFMTELEWVRGQVKSSGCACCHSSKTLGYASKWDIDAPGVWTDTIPMAGIVMGAGFADEHTWLGYLPPDSNHGFNRQKTVLATNDIERMQAFFKKEFERRGGSQADIDKASQQFRSINFQLFEEATPCEAGEGVGVDGTIFWNGEGARQIYIQEEDADNPGFPPTFDLPSKTLWALYVDTESKPLESGTVTMGEIPQGSKQMMPDMNQKMPSLEEGKKYRLFITPDFMRPRQTNCIFTYGEDQEPEAERTCDDPNSVCITLQIPEELTVTPDALLIGFYKELPPVGPPNIFPPLRIDKPELEAGSSIEFALNGSKEGNFLIFAVIYMPEGGLVSWRPLAGVDYVGQSEMLELTGEPMTIEMPIHFTLAE